MKNTLISFCCLFSCLLCGCSIAHVDVAPPIALIPQPVEVNPLDGSFKISSSTGIQTDMSNPELATIATYVVSKLEWNTGIQIHPKGKLKLLLEENPELGEEGYKLQIKKAGITITANQPAGVFYGVQTLLQLLPPESKNYPLRKTFTSYRIPYLEITDRPEFGWRGIMLDVSRHWFTVDEVKTLLDQMAEYKFNVFHWHLTDDQGWRIEIPGLERLTEVGAWRVPRVGQWWHREPAQPGEAATYGGFYTQEEIREVIQYAAERYIRVIPEIDVPGHNLAALVAYPHLACLEAPKTVNVGNKFYGIDENSLCAGKETTFEWLEKVFTEVATLFPDEYIHIGGDECFKGFWKQCPHCQKRMREEGLKDVEELQSYFIKRVSDMLAAKGKKIIGWDEIHEGGLAEGATVMSWRGMEGGKAAALAGHKVIMTPDHHCYLDLYQGEPSVEPDTYSMCRLSDSYGFNPVPDGIPKELILGGQGNLWAESVPTWRHAEYMLWPRGWALAEVLWSGPENTDWEKFIPRVEHHFKRSWLDKPNVSKSMYNAIITPFRTEDGTVFIELGCEIPDSRIHYTFDNTDPDQYTSQYIPGQPLSIPKDATWLRVITYHRGGITGKVITLTTDELRQRAQKETRSVGNLGLDFVYQQYEDYR